MFEDGFDLPFAIPHGADAHHRVGEMDSDQFDPDPVDIEAGCEPGSMRHVDLIDVDRVM